MGSHHELEFTSPFHNKTPRMPQFNTANQSASQRGQAASEPCASRTPRPVTGNVAPSTVSTVRASSTETDDTIEAEKQDDAGYETAPPTASGSGPQATSTPANSPALSPPPSPTSLSISITDVDCIAAGSGLTTDNLHFHDIVHKPADSTFLFNKNPSPDPSSALDIELGSHHHSSEYSSERRESFVPVADNAQHSDIFGVGFWADAARPPTG